MFVEIESQHLMKPFKYLVSLLPVLALLLVFQACKKDGSDPAPGTVTPASTATLSGIVTDAAGIPVAGASITVAGKTGTSNSDGIFSISSVPADGNRVLVKASKTGYFDGSQGLVPAAGSVSKTEIVLHSDAPGFDGDVSQPNSFVVNGTGIELPANSVSSSGSFQAAVIHLNPADPDFEKKVPGGDLIGIDAGNNEKQLLSFGMLMVKLTDANGKETNLAAGKTATVRMKIPQEQLATAPASIPLWHFDESSGKWMEEGNASRQGDSYVGSVSHFSAWNCDYPSERATVKGIIRDCNGKPVQNLRVRIGQTVTYTNDNGEYQRYVPSGTAFTVEADAPEFAISSNPVTINPLAAGATQTIADIIVPCRGGVSFNVGCSSGGFVNVIYNIKWGNNNSINGTWTSSGLKVIPVPANGQAATFILTNSVTGYSVSGSLVFPSSPDTADKGSINICAAAPADSLITTLTVNGDGFNNQVIHWSGMPLTSFLVFSDADSASTFVSASATGFAISGGFSGAPTIGPKDNAMIAFSTSPGRVYAGDSMIVFNIIQTGEIGQKVSGSFSGRLKRVEFDTASQEVREYPITVTGGSFQLIRRPYQ